ncbi:GNAT family N-acetyltransferase [Fructobacillus sp. M2-14]|uniref:GNAT family N-acetyltransferase n=1 Tax=Fructobacillus broussonetiae TaxID=2713173 RepID=A0ABS5QZ18_9LACO|nr:GNAT family N-acetyltransferase [Fructobacillus broussonetiae]MBS9338400.1 GNAT family N-acetyltransferase [Fructobacillus broussonetiae]
MSEENNEEVTLSYSLRSLDLNHANDAQNLLSVLHRESDTFALANELARQTTESVDEDQLDAELEEMPQKTWLIWAEAQADDGGEPLAYPVGIGSISAGEVGIAILADYQNQGLGRLTIQAMTDWAEDVGYDKLWLDVDVENAPARHLYDELGFDVQAGQEQQVTLDTGRTATLERREKALV